MIKENGSSPQITSLELLRRVARQRKIEKSSTRKQTIMISEVELI